MLRLFFKSMLLFQVSPAIAASWLCVADVSSGFSWDEEKNSFTPTAFNTTERKYLIRPANGEDRLFLNEATFALV